ncbi:hypothetical protein HIM_01906 [Hirsutella minnesotensis 3608]|nr:hypothetical protein HIM_01906 [Hirsutella minnesotensis 3608]
MVEKSTVDSSFQSVPVSPVNSSISHDASEPAALIESQTYAVPEDRKLGVGGAVLLIFNKVIGTGIFSTPSIVFAVTGSVGISLILWMIGGVLAFCGLSVFLEFGLAIPRSGGTKNYIERVYRHPRYLGSCLVAAYMVLLGFSSANALSFGRYILRASSGHESDGWPARAVAVAAATFAVIMHGVAPKWGIRLFNLLGVVKIFALIFVVISGFAALAGHRLVPDPRNFDNAFSSTLPDRGGAYAYSKALLSIIYSYGGWEGATYVMGEMKNPGRTLSIAAPSAIGCVTVLYLLVNVAYFAAIPKLQLAGAEVLVADVFFRNIFGNNAAAHVLPLFVAASNLGNVLASSFTNSRFIQELAKEGILPLSRFWASNKPFNAPAASLFLHWTVTTIVLIAPPAGPAYTLLISVSSYAGAWVSSAVAAGLLWLQYKKSENWSSPWHTYLPITLAFLSANLLLIIVPLIPPPAPQKAGEYPYYIFPIVALGSYLLGAVYWAFWRKIIPHLRGRQVISDRTFDEHGAEVIRYREVVVERRPVRDD